MREPQVKNKYNLTVRDLKRLRVKNEEMIKEPLFWRNNVIQAWCMMETTAKSRNDVSCNTFWIGVYDKDAKAYAGKVRVTFSAYDDMCNYIFNNFYDYREIEREADLEIQERFLSRINYLLDNGILCLQEEENETNKSKRKRRNHSDIV